ncbi:UNVERIFIED_CONTAM: hypothetical protein Slati_2378700 [Sesamum latifolium]|uniref:Reverse transcriptase domain-containing protein n=1 Tax=Sesamum latifolium TaxID=2727402 RepID=A0AAW2WAW5_9LAMI
MEEALGSMDKRVTTAVNEELLKPFTAEEIMQALKQMHLLKSPGPDGMPPIFYQKHCLCNVLYKLASKTIANRLKPLLDILIPPSQSAFVPGHLITDSVLVAYELNHQLKLKNRGKKGCVSLKLDISKAYDRVEWSFLERALGRLGFHPHFMALIMSCVSTISFSFL